MSTHTIVISDPANRVLVRHEGPPGLQGEQGDPGEVHSPGTVFDGHLVAFDGTDGVNVKDSGIAMTDVVLVDDVALKVDIVAGKELSTNDFTNIFKAKLDALVPGGYVGTYDTLVALEADFPTAINGDYAYVTDTGIELIPYFWDDINTEWTGSDLSEKVDVEAGKGLSQNDFTDSYKGLVETAVQTVTFDAAVVSFQAALDAVANDVLTEAGTARTLSGIDLNRYIRLTNVAGCTLTLPADATALWTGNPEIRFRINEVTLPTFSLAGGVTLENGAAVAGLAQYDNFSIKRVGADQWELIL